MTALRICSVALLVLMALVSSGCELVGDIFQAGMAVGVILVVLAVGAVIWMVAKVRS